MCRLIQNKVIVEKKRKQSQLQQKGFGERTEQEFVLDMHEALYLVEKKKISLKDRDGKKVSKKKLVSYASRREKNFYNKFVVYRNLRDRGFCTKTGFKFGFDFRVYPRGKKPGQAHTQWVVHVASQNERFSMSELSRMVRLSGNIRTQMLIAVVDSENDINYYRVERITP
jgi:tRNA-intron endonuclease